MRVGDEVVGEGSTTTGSDDSVRIGLRTVWIFGLVGLAEEGGTDVLGVDLGDVELMLLVLPGSDCLMLPDLRKPPDIWLNYLLALT